MTDLSHPGRADLILAAAGRAELKRIRGLPNTTDTLTKVPNALKGYEEENR